MSTETVTSAERRRLKFYLMVPAWPGQFIPPIFVGGGCALIVTGLGLWRFRLGMLGVVLAVIGAIVWLAYRLFVSTQKEFDAIAEKDYVRAQSLVLDRLGITANDLRHPTPCKFRYFTPPPKEPRSLDVYRGLRKGTDEKLRRTPVDYTIVNFGATHLFVFKCTMDLTTGNLAHEEIHELAYREMACVETTLERDTIKVGFFRGNSELIAYWKPLGVERVNGVLQLDGKQTLGIRLNNNEHMVIAEWSGHGLGAPSGEGRKSAASARELQRVLREIKPGAVPARKLAEPSPGPRIHRVRGAGGTS